MLRSRCVWSVAWVIRACFFFFLCVCVCLEKNGLHLSDSIFVFTTNQKQSGCMKKKVICGSAPPFRPVPMLFVLSAGWGTMPVHDLSRQKE